MKQIFQGILLLLLLCIISNSQTLMLQGKTAPGNLIVAKAPGAVSVTLNNRNIAVDKKGNFLIGFDRDDKGDFFLRIKYDNGKSFLKKFKLSERKYKIQKINNMKEELVSPPDNELDRIEKESSTIDSIESKIGIDIHAYYADGFVRPVSGGRISGVFGSQRILNGVPKNPHNGVDIALPEGTEVSACADGIVVMTGKDYFYRGNFVIIDHGQGLFSRYFHLSKITVSEGSKISKGDKLGEVGTTGRSTGPHLHWSLQLFEKRIDPFCVLYQ